LTDNLTPHHLLQCARIAYNKDTAEVFGDFTGLDPLNLPRTERPTPVAVPEDAEALRRELRRIIMEEIKAALAA
jgi:hypothetical protein